MAPEETTTPVSVHNILSRMNKIIVDCTSVILNPHASREQLNDAGGRLLELQDMLRETNDLIGMCADQMRNLTTVADALKPAS